jgi:predicted TIM-barrel fold metal-dependent hydrolase
MPDSTEKSSSDSESLAATGVSRRRLIAAASAAAFIFLQRRASGRPIAASMFFDDNALEQIGDRDSDLRPPLLIDAQTHVWWRAGGLRTMTPSGEQFLKALAGSRAKVVGKPVAIADMGRMMFIEDMFLHSETDIAFLNSFGMRAAFDGVDLFPPREAAMIRSMAPARIRVLGCVDPPDGQSAVHSLIYQCEQLAIDGLKLYPPGPVKAGWRMDDEKNTYPLYEVLRKHGVKNVCAHKGLPGLFLESYCHTEDLARAAADFPDLNFIAFHSAYPFDEELAEHAKRAKVKNIYAEMGSLAPLMYAQPERYAHMLGRLLDGLGADHLLWGTDTPVVGPPHWQIQAFQAYQIPDQLADAHGYQKLTPAIKRKIFGENAARLFGIDIQAARKQVEADLLYRLRMDGNPLPNTIDVPGVHSG